MAEREHSRTWSSNCIGRLCVPNLVQHSAGARRRHRTKVYERLRGHLGDLQWWSSSRGLRRLPSAIAGFCSRPPMMVKDDSTDKCAARMSTSVESGTPRNTPGRSCFVLRKRDCGNSLHQAISRARKKSSRTKTNDADGDSEMEPRRASDDTHEDSEMNARTVGKDADRHRDLIEPYGGN